MQLLIHAWNTCFGANVLQCYSIDYWGWYRLEELGQITATDYQGPFKYKDVLPVKEFNVMVRLKGMLPHGRQAHDKQSNL